MKSFFILLSVVFMFAISSCKDEPTPFEEPETAMYFNGIVNDYEKAIVEGQNGYRVTLTDSCGTLDNGVNWFGSALIFQGNANYFMSNRESFGLRYYNLHDIDLVDRDAVINNYFSSSMPFMFIDTTGAVIDEFAYGVEVVWIDGKGDYYTTLFTQQSNNFVFDDFTMSQSITGRSIKITGSFSCNLYSLEEEKQISLTDGKARINVNTACF
jgi:hypothetical protein